MPVDRGRAAPRSRLLRRHGVELADLDTMLRQADVLTVHARTGDRSHDRAFPSSRYISPAPTRRAASTQRATSSGSARLAQRAAGGRAAGLTERGSGSQHRRRRFDGGEGSRSGPRAEQQTDHARRRPSPDGQPLDCLSPTPTGMRCRPVVRGRQLRIGERHSSIASSTRSRVQRRSIAPGWQAAEVRRRRGALGVLFRRRPPEPGVTVSDHRALQ